MRFAIIGPALLFAAGNLLPVGMQAQESVRRFGDWLVQKSRDVMTDEITTVAFTADSTSRDVSRLQYYALGVMCIDEPTVILLTTGFYFPSDPSVRYRFDDRAAAPYSLWFKSSGMKGATLPSRELRSFLETARKAAQIRMRIRDPLDGEITDLTFSLMGFTRAAGRLPCVSNWYEVEREFSAAWERCGKLLDAEAKESCEQEVTACRRTTGQRIEDFRECSAAADDPKRFAWNAAYSEIWHRCRNYQSIRKAMDCQLRLRECESKFGAEYLADSLKVCVATADSIPGHS